MRLDSTVAPDAVQAFVQGGNDTIFSAENVALNPGSFTGTPAPVVDSAGVTDVFLQGVNPGAFINGRPAMLPRPGWAPR